MANTYSQIYLHVIIVVKFRENLITPTIKEPLYKYICGIVNNKKEKVYNINGMPDHVHILISVKPDTVLSNLMRDLKANSAKWINEKRLSPGIFRWQKGFAVFSVSRGNLDRVMHYIDNQEEHHSKKSFRNEYLELLKENDVNYDERYIFETFE